MQDRVNIIKALKYSLCQKLNLNAEMFSQIEMPKEIKNSFIKLKGEFENFNIENEKKLELIKVNIEELKKHFETKSLDVLKTLKFQFDELTPERDKTVYYENSSLNQEKLELEPTEDTH